MSSRDKKDKLTDKMSHNLRYAAAQQLADAQASMDFMDMLVDVSGIIHTVADGMGMEVIETLDDPAIQVTHDTPIVK